MGVVPAFAAGEAGQRRSLTSAWSWWALRFVESRRFAYTLDIEW